MNGRNYLYSAVILFTALPWAFAPCSASAELVTFQVTGHMIDPLPPAISVNDKFTADYTFESTTQAQHYDPNNDIVTYNAITEWHLTFDNGLSFSSIPESPDPIDLWNNVHIDHDPVLSDRYQPTLSGRIQNPITFPAGQTLQYLQFILNDQSPEDNPDLLSSSVLPLSSPILALCEYPAGRLMVESNQSIQQIDCAVDSISVVPEPSSAVLSIIGFGLLLVSKRRVLAL